MTDPDTILDAAVAVFGYPMDALLSPDRHQGLATARHVTMYVMRSLTDLSYPAIGRRFHRDHTTVLYAVDVVAKRLSGRNRYSERWLALMGALGQNENRPRL